MFIWNHGDLNGEQESAIHEEGSILLIACPGSGKTRTLTYKIAFELSKLKSEKEYVIAITYTNAAADEIKERVELLGVDISQLWIGTIHSFCTEWVLRPYSLYIEELKHGFKILNSHDSEELLNTLCAAHDSPKINYYDCQFFATINNYKITSLEEHKHSSIRSVLQKYFEKLKQNNQIDYEQILHYSYEILKNNPIICSILSKIFPYVLIDEFQDTKEIQYHIIFSIIKAGLGRTKLFIVGDPNQSIYDTLGGYPMPKSEMEEIISFTLVEKHLESNYRSSAKIIGYFDFFKTYPNRITPAGSVAAYSSMITFNRTINHSILEDEIVRLILDSINNKGIQPNEICIAAPQWIPLASLTRKLMVRLPDYSFDGPGMAPFSRDNDNFWYKLSRIVLTEPSPNLYIRRIRWAKEVLDELNYVGAAISEVVAKDLLRICNSINIEEKDGLKYLREAFDEILNQLKINILIFPLLTEHHQSFFNSSEARIERLRNEGNEFIGSISNFRKVFKQRKGIKISTIHGVKGTEYDVMIGFGLLQNWVPHFNDSNGVLNSKKMLYVLASRARKHLHIISESGRHINRYNPKGWQPTSHLVNYVYEYD